jgi:parallel beta-helix repeat protein
MTISTTTSRQSYNGNGVTTEFAVPFRFFANTDLVVQLVTISTGASTTLTLTTHYTVTGADDEDGGMLTMVTAPAVGQRLVIRRVIAATQEVDYVAGDPFPAETHERALDRLTMLAQQGEEVNARALVFPAGDTASGELPAVATRASRLLGFDSSGNLVTSAPASGSAAELAIDLAGPGGAGLVGTVDGQTVEQRLSGSITTVGSTLQAAITAAAGKTLTVIGSHTITANTVLPSGITIIGAPGSEVVTSTADVSHFYANGQSNITIKGLKFRRTSATGSAFVSGVRLENCTGCVVESNEFEGMQWSGVYLDSSSWCKVRDNYFHSALVSTAGDRADIHVYRNASHNIVENNRCFGGKGSGIFIQDPLAAGAFLPQSNKITGNRVGSCEVYGILVYIGSTGSVTNSWNEVSNNEVENIQGDPAVQLDTGFGIYCVGAGIGGLIVTGNTVKNACIETTSASNGPAGINVADYPAGTVKAIVSGNVVSGMTQGDGIRITGCAGAVVSNNSVHMPVTNNGTGPGGATLIGQGVRVVNSSHTLVTANQINVEGAGRGVLLDAGTLSLVGNSVIGNSIVTNGSTGHGVQAIRTSTNTHTSTRIALNSIICNGASANALNFTGLLRGTVSGNTGTSGIAWLYLRNVVSTKHTDNTFLVSGGGNDIDADGANTGSIVDESNEITGSVFNSAAGLIVIRYGDAAPVVGTAQIGDRVIRRTSTIGSPKGWQCTTAGSPGTWTSEGNL